MSTIISSDTCLSQQQENEAKPTAIERAFHSLDGTIKKIKEIQSHLIRVSIKSRHEIGQLLMRNWNEVQAARQMCITRKLDFWETFAEIVGLHSRILRECLKFAEQYEASQVDDLLEHGVTWTHVVHLMKLHTQEEREQFLKQISENGLTAAALEKAIVKKKQDAKTRSEKPKANSDLPKSLEEGLERALTGTAQINGDFKLALFCEEFDLTTAVMNTPPDEIKKETRDQLIELIDHIRELNQIMPDILDRLEGESLPWIEQVLALRENDKSSVA